MVDFIAREAEKAGISTEEAMLMAMEHGWRSFEAAYLRNQAQPMRTSAPAQDIPPVIDYHRGINPDGTF